MCQYLTYRNGLGKKLQVPELLLQVLDCEGYDVGGAAAGGSDGGGYGKPDYLRLVVSCAGAH
jgi:hypothetical protein